MIYRFIYIFFYITYLFIELYRIYSKPAYIFIALDFFMKQKYNTNYMNIFSYYKKNRKVMLHTYFKYFVTIYEHYYDFTVFTIIWYTLKDT